MYHAYTTTFGNSTQAKIAYTVLCIVATILTFSATVIVADAWLIIRPTGITATPYVCGGIALFILTWKLMYEVGQPWAQKQTNA